MLRHLDVDLIMADDGSFSIEVSESETGESIGWDYKPGAMYRPGELVNVIDEIYDWLVLMDEERSER